MWPFERAALGAWRRRLAAHARGRVLEVGTGTGSQLRWYPAGVTVVALEPDLGMALRARRAAARASAAIEVVEGFAERLPFPAASFDSAVTSFSLCTRRRSARGSRRVAPRADPRRSPPHARACAPGLAAGAETAEPGRPSLGGARGWLPAG